MAGGVATGGAIGPSGELVADRRHSWAARHQQALLPVPALILLLLVGLVGTVGWIGSQRAIHPGRKVEPHRLSEYAFAGMTELVRFNSADGTPLASWFVPAGRGGPAATVILLHGYGRSRAELLPHAGYLHQAGYNVLLFDFRGRGESGGGEVTIGVREPGDVRGAIDYVLSRPDVDPARVALQGVSLGAASAILETQADPRVAAIVSESAFTDLRGVINRSFEHFIGLPSFPFAPVTVFLVEQRLHASASTVRPIDAITRIGNRPVLIIDDMLDTEIPADSGVRLFAAAPGPKELWLVPGAGHAGGYGARPQEYERRVLAFLGRYLAK